MPSLTARLIASLFRMTGSLRKRYSDGPDFQKFIEQSRAEQQYPDAKMRKRLDVRESSYEGRKIFRIAHLGYADTFDAITAIAGIEMVLKGLGHPVKLGTGVGAAQEILMK